MTDKNVTSEKVPHFISSFQHTKIEVSIQATVNQCKYLILFLYAYVASPLSFATLGCCFKLNDQTGVFLCLGGTLITQQLAQQRWRRETLRHDCNVNKHIESKTREKSLMKTNIPLSFKQVCLQFCVSKESKRI